jgi:hypothetical protein
MPALANALHSRPKAHHGAAVLAPHAVQTPHLAQHEKGWRKPLPGPDAGETQPEPKRDQQSPPGQFVSDEHEADCSRFLEEVKEFIRHRSEAGLWRER